MPDELLLDAAQRADARLRGIIEATDEGGSRTLAHAAMAVAGTDLNGVELTRLIGGYAEQAVDHAIEVEEFPPELRRTLFRVLNGTAISWFLTGYEARRLQEGS